MGFETSGFCSVCGSGFGGFGFKVWGCFRLRGLGFRSVI